MGKTTYMTVLKPVTGHFLALGFPYLRRYGLTLPPGSVPIDSVILCLRVSSGRHTAFLFPSPVPFLRLLLVPEQGVGKL